MTPSAAVQLLSDEHTSNAQGFAFAFSANSNSKKKASKPRKKHICLPLPPREVRSLAQSIEAADEGWQDLWSANLLRSERQDTTDDTALLVAFSRVVHAVIDDRDLCGQLLNYFDEKLQKEFADRQGSVKR